MTNDGFHSYAHDAEGNIMTVDGGSTASYIYDALNHRGRSIVGGEPTEFAYNVAGQRATTYAGFTGTVTGQYYWGGKRVAYYNGGSLHFQHQDWMGTERTRTTYNGAVEGTFTSLPFGDGLTTASGTDTDAYHFAQIDHDYETDTEHAQFRQYSSAQGRFLSPDPYGGSYDPSNPQSFNRYAYVMNNPLSAVDPSGLCPPPGRDGKAQVCIGDGGGQGNDGFISGIDEFDYMNIAIQLPSDDDDGENWQPGYGWGFWTWGGPAPTGAITVPVTAPNNGQEPPPACQAKILNATNNQFGTNYTNANVSSTFNYSTGAGPGQGTLNLNISGSTAGVSPGYYPIHWWTYAIGYGSTLHVVGGDVLDSPQTLQFGPNQGTFHIDSGFPYNPIGAFFHWLLNMTKAGGYPQC